MALVELELAQERKARLKGDTGRPKLGKNRHIAGQELLRHAEHQISKEDAKKDLEAIALQTNQGNNGVAEPAKQRRRSSTTTS